jgi:predicted Rossmann-fold nucleotide-binding protein
MHSKPCGLLDIEDYYAGISQFLAHAVEERFLPERQRAMLMVEREPSALLRRMRDWQPSSVQPKWIDRDET